MQKLLTLPQPKMTTEAGFYRQMKSGAKKLKDRKLTLTRIENWAVAGMPDVMICDEKGFFHFVELKFCKANAVGLRPQQIAWLTKNSHSSSFVLIKQQSKAENKAVVSLYNASQAIDLASDGLKTEPVYRKYSPFKWSEIFNLICPI